MEETGDQFGLIPEINPTTEATAKDVVEGDKAPGSSHGPLVDMPVGSVGFRSIENKKFPTTMNKNKPRSDLRDAKQRAREIRSTYPCRLHSGNVQMNVVGVVVLVSPSRDPI
jgi:hypothetical protein